MKIGRFTGEQIIGVLRMHAAGAKATDLCRQHGISDLASDTVIPPYLAFQLYSVASLEDENRRLKKLVAEAMLDNAALKDIASGKF